LQNGQGQQLEAATSVAAAAVVTNTPIASAINPISRAFIVSPFMTVNPVRTTLRNAVDLNVKALPLDLQADLKVCCTHDMAGLLIGDVAARAGVAAPTIRYYESIGLLKPPTRSDAGYRRYAEGTIEELRFIRKAQGLGFSLDEIAEILNLSRSGKAPCSHVLSLAHRHLVAVDARIRQLRAFRRQLAVGLAKWDKQEGAVTCNGLCQFISEADTPPGAEPINLHLEPGHRKSRSVRTNRGQDRVRRRRQ
jgi:MerR family copper efflux transcriptional regulator